MSDQPDPTEPTDEQEAPHTAGGRSRTDRDRLVVLAVAAVVMVLIAVLAGLVLTREDVAPTDTDDSAIPGSLQVPDVIGMSGQRALETLQELGLTIGRPSAEGSTEAPSGVVIDQTPQAGAAVKSGAAVTLVFSHGTVPVAMPDVVGLPEDEATAALDEAGLFVSTVESYEPGVADGVVIDQFPEAGGPAGTGMVITIEVSAGPTGQAGAVTVPDVVGTDVYEGAAGLQRVGLVAQPFYSTETNELQGTILDQVPAAGSEVAAGSTVQITVSARAQPPASAPGG